MAKSTCCQFLSPIPRTHMTAEDSWKLSSDIHIHNNNVRRPLWVGNIVVVYLPGKHQVPATLLPNTAECNRTPVWNVINTDPRDCYYIAISWKSGVTPFSQAFCRQAQNLGPCMYFVNTTAVRTPGLWLNYTEIIGRYHNTQFLGRLWVARPMELEEVTWACGDGLWWQLWFRV